MCLVGVDSCFRKLHLNALGKDRRSPHCHSSPSSPLKTIEFSTLVYKLSGLSGFPGTSPLEIIFFKCVLESSDGWISLGNALASAASGQGKIFQLILLTSALVRGKVSPACPHPHTWCLSFPVLSPGLLDADRHLW